MRRHLVGLSLFLISLSSFTPPANAADIKVMSQNQYLGANLFPILAAPDGDAFNAAVVAALQQIAANRPAERVKAQAAEILKEQPALVGLQEVFEFQCSGPGCSDPSIAAAFTDHLQDTLDALNGAYVLKATVVDLNVPGVPFSINGQSAAVSVLDRDVILARADVEATPVNYAAFQNLGICLKPSADGCNYSFVLSATTPLGPITVERGYVAVDATVGDQAYRLVNTHLDEQFPNPANPLSQIYQAVQAAELVQVLSATTPSDRSLILLGDMNSSPVHPVNNGIIPPYQQFIAAGYTDDWTLRPGTLPGYTCCQLDNLSNLLPTLSERLDLVLSRNAPSSVKDARVVGATASDRTPPGLGLWPSDHGGVTADMQF